MNSLELQLKDYLNKNPEIIKKSLESSYLYYDFIKVNNVEIEDDEYVILHCQIIRNASSDAVTTLQIPKNFLRKIKLNKINSLSLYKIK